MKTRKKNLLVFTETKGRYSFPIGNWATGSYKFLNHSIWNLFTDVTWKIFFFLLRSRKLRNQLKLTDKHCDFRTLVKLDCLIGRNSGRRLCVKLWTWTYRRTSLLHHLKHDEIFTIFPYSSLKYRLKLTGGAYIWCGGGCRVWLFEYIAVRPNIICRLLEA